MKRSSSSRKKSRRGLQNSRQRRSKSQRSRRSQRNQCTRLSDQDLHSINSITPSWDISKPPSLGKNSSRIVLCQGRMSLLLPVTIPQGLDTSILMYEHVIKKRNIHISDILLAIYKFYNVKRVSPKDIDNFGYVNSYKGLVAQIQNHPSKEYTTFRKFLGSNLIYFGGLELEKGSTYRVLLRHST